MNVAFIPVRGGSKSIPLKNIKPLNGKPLVYWTVKAACGCRYIDQVFVATDSERIREVAEGFKTGEEAELFRKLTVIGRSRESASDTASTESAMLEFAAQYEFDHIVLVQATSPLLLKEDLDRGFEVFSEADTDSVLSVVPQKRFCWKVNQAGYAQPANYDVFHRPRRQEFEGYLVENGAFYITSKADLIKSGNRISGNIKAVEMDEDTFFEIDEPGDWTVIEALMQKKKQSCSSRENKVMPEIKMFLTDCDGCLTDGGMYYSEKGDELKKFNTRDGMGIAMLREQGIVTGLITGEGVQLNCNRAGKLQMDIVEMNCKDKASVIKRLCREYGVALNQVAYVGDDLNDLEAIKLVGFGCCPADAVVQVRQAAGYVAKLRGGEGVIREIAELICSETGNLTRTEYGR